MKKIIAIMLVCFVSLSFFACGNNESQESNPLDNKVTIGESTKFSDEELQEGKNAVLKEFEDPANGLELISLLYDEKTSDKIIEGSINDGGNLIKSEKAEDVMIFRSKHKQYLSKAYTGSDFKEDDIQMHSRFKWIVVRGEDGKFYVKDCGY